MKKSIFAGAMALTVTTFAAPVGFFDAIAAAAAQGDAARGQKLYIQCAYCHGNNGEGAGAGPSLRGVVGRKAAGDPAFAYSDAMKGAGIVWTDAKLHEFLANPRTSVPRTRMIFVGVRKATDQDDIIAYLKTLK